MGHQLLIRSLGLGLFSVERVPEGEGPISDLDLDSAAYQVGSLLVASVCCRNNPEKAYIACSEGHEPCPQELSQFSEEIESLALVVGQNTTIDNRAVQINKRLTSKS